MGPEWRARTSNFRTVAERTPNESCGPLHYCGMRSNWFGGDLRKLVFALIAITSTANRMYKYRESMKVGVPRKRTYYMPQEFQIINVFRSVTDKIEDLNRAATPLPLRQSLVSTQSAGHLGHSGQLYRLHLF